MTRPDPGHAPPPPGFRAALGNRKAQMLIGFLAAVSAASAAALAVTATQDDAPVSRNRAEIERIVHDYILEHPEILPQAMERLQAKRVSATIDEYRQEIETPYANAAWEGAKDADVVVVEFFDYACGYCRASLPDLAKLMAADPRVKIVYRELPILSEQSGAAARVSLLAAEQGKYAAFHQAVYAAGPVTRDSILAAAARVGIDRSTAQAALTDKRYDAEIEKNLRLAQALGANGTPTFVVGDRLLNGAVGYDALRKAVEGARERK